MQRGSSTPYSPILGPNRLGAQHRLTQYRDHAARSLLSRSRADCLEIRARIGRFVRNVAIEISEAEDVGGAALSLAVKPRSAGIIRPW